MEAFIAELMEQGETQREIHRQTGVSRDYIRSYANKIGFDFTYGGSAICMCANCGRFFKREYNRIEGKKESFCDVGCKREFSHGVNHPRWKHGKSANTFSTWVKNTSDYHKWKTQLLEDSGYRCAISDREYDLDCHHLIEKSKDNSKTFDINNGLVLNREVHRDLHKLTRNGLSFEEAFTELNIKYQKLDNGDVIND